MAASDLAKPLATSNDGSQLSNRYSTIRVRKKLSHNSPVVRPRPSSVSAASVSARRSRGRSAKAGDSGRRAAITAPMATGVRPPIQKTTRQSSAGTKASRALAMPPPAGMAADSQVTRAAARSGAVDSAIRAIRLGRAPPRPSPVRNRMATRALLSGLTAVATLNTPNRIIEAIRTRRRPIWSARRPPAMAPMNRPSVLAVNTQLR